MHSRARMIRRALLLAALICAEHHAHATSCVPGFDYGAFASCGVTMQGGGVTNSYDSSIGNYAASQSSPASNGNLGENCTTAGSVQLSGSTTTVNGEIDYGPGGSTGSVISTSGGASYSTSGALGSTLTLTPVTIPTVGTNQGDLTCSSDCSPATNQTYGNVSVKSSGTIITLSAGTYVMDTFSMTGNSILNVGTGPIIVYVSCTSSSSGFDLSGGTVQNSTQKSTDLVFMLSNSCTTAKITGGVSSSYAVYAPGTDITIAGGGTIYGAVVGKTVTDRGGSAICYDKALQNFVGGGFSCSSTEVSRASPVIASVSSATAIVQGTYESPTGLATTLSDSASIGLWSFPWIRGHMRARTASTVNSSSFSSGTVLFDAGAAGKIPAASGGACSAPYSGTCRAIFPNTNTTAASGTTFGSARNVKPLDASNSTTSTTIGSQIVSGLTGSNYMSIIAKILAGSLGGVDRSTVAVIGASTIAGNGARPTMAYFGALDGEIHAVCASTGGTTATKTTICPALGTELWAFLPRVSLPLLKNNVGRIA